MKGKAVEIDIELIKRFLILCESSSMTKAANSLYISQQALSRSLALLEQKIGSPLFIRTAKGILLTENGKCFESLMRPAIATYDTALISFQEQLTAEDNILYLAFSPHVLQTVSYDLLYRFRLQHPHIQLKGVELSDDACIECLYNKNADLAFCAKPGDISLVDYHQVGQDDIIAIVSNNIQDKRENKFKSISLFELINYRLVCFNRNFIIHKIVSDAFLKIGLSPDFIVESGDADILINMVSNNDCVLLCSKLFASKICKKNNLFLDVPDIELPWSYGILNRKNDHLKQSAKDFIYFLNNYQGNHSSG